jgi:HK97 family phage major capsid protein
VGGTNGKAPAWSHLLGLESELATDNADVGGLAYLTNAKVRGKLKQTFINSTYGERPVWEQAPGDRPGWGSIAGYRAACTNQVPSTLNKGSSLGVCSAIIFGDWSSLMIGQWGSLDILVDRVTGGLKGTVRIIAFMDVDVAVKHAESFAAMQDALTA